MRKRWIATAALPTALFAGGVALAANGPTAHVAQTGGLSISPALIEHKAAVGSSDKMVVTNRSAAPLTVKVTPRPWLESGKGAFSADRRHTLSQLRLSTTSFTLAPGAEQAIDVKLAALPAAGALYGAVEVVGLPADAAKRKGVVLGYRLLGAVRMLPATKKYGIKVASAAKRVGTDIVLPVTNTGNTLDPVTITVKAKGPRSVNAKLPVLKLLPGKQVKLVIASRLKKGSYSATVTFAQRGQKTITAKRKFSVR